MAPDAKDREFNKELYTEVAMRAMQGILSNPQWFKFRGSRDGSFIKDAFEQANEFMIELEKRLEKGKL